MAVEFDAGCGLAGVLARGGADWLEVAGAGVPAATGGWLLLAAGPAILRVAEAGSSSVTGVAEPEPLIEGVRGRLGDAAARVAVGAGELALAWLSGSAMAPAKVVSGRRAEPDTTMVVTATALIVVAATDNQKVGGRTAGMSESCHAVMAKVSNEST